MVLAKSKKVRKREKGKDDLPYFWGPVGERGREGQE